MMYLLQRTASKSVSNLKHIVANVTLVLFRLLDHVIYQFHVWK